GHVDPVDADGGIAVGPPHGAGGGADGAGVHAEQLGERQLHAALAGDHDRVGAAAGGAGQLGVGAGGGVVVDEADFGGWVENEAADVHDVLAGDAAGSVDGGGNAGVLFGSAGHRGGVHSGLKL